MFSGKLKYYDKPCKWLKFLLNVFMPLVVLGGIYDIIQMIIGWTPFEAIGFTQDVLFVVIFILVDLLARFLDKTAFVSLIIGHAFAIVNDLFALIYTLVLLRQANSVVTEGGGFLGGMVNSYLGMVSGLITAFEIIGALILLSIYIASLCYVIRRKELFIGDLHPEDAEFDDETPDTAVEG